MLIFGVIMSGDTRENVNNVCVLQNACLHEVNAKVKYSIMKRCLPVRADVRILHSKEVLGGAHRGCGAASGVGEVYDAAMVNCLASRSCSEFLEDCASPTVVALCMGARLTV